MHRCSRWSLAPLVSLAACATTASVRSVPLDAGETHVYALPLPAVVAAARAAMDTAGLQLDTVFNPDSRTVVLIATGAISPTSWGEVVRLIVQAEPDGRTLVRAYTATRAKVQADQPDRSGQVLERMGHALAGLPSDAASGAPAPSAAGWAPQSAALLAVRPGSKVRVRLQDGTALNSVAVGGLDSALVLPESGRLDQGAFRYVPARAIDSLWVRHTHARIGGVVGLVAGSVAYLLLRPKPQTCPLEQYGECLAESATKRLLTGVGVMLGGYLVGSFVGGRFVSWRLRYP